MRARTSQVQALRLSQSRVKRTWTGIRRGPHKLKAGVRRACLCNVYFLPPRRVRSAHSAPGSMGAFTCQSKTSPDYTVDYTPFFFFHVLLFIIYILLSCQRNCNTYIITVFSVTDIFFAPLSPVFIREKGIVDKKSFSSMKLIYSSETLFIYLSKFTNPSHFLLYLT